MIQRLRLVGQELGRLFRFDKAVKIARLRFGIGIEDRRDGIAEALDLEAFEGLIVAVILDRFAEEGPVAL